MLNVEGRQIESKSILQKGGWKMLNLQVERMGVQMSGLLAQSRQLGEESHDLLMQVRRKEDELSKNVAFEHRRFHRSGRGTSYPQNQARDFVAALQVELDELNSRRSLVLELVESTRKEIQDLSGLLDRCREHVGEAPEFVRKMVW